MSAYKTFVNLRLQNDKPFIIWLVIWKWLFTPLIALLGSCMWNAIISQSNFHIFLLLLLFWKGNPPTSTFSQLLCLCFGFQAAEPAEHLPLDAVAQWCQRAEGSDAYRMQSMTVAPGLWRRDLQGAHRRDACRVQTKMTNRPASFLCPLKLEDQKGFRGLDLEELFFSFF